MNIHDTADGHSLLLSNLSEEKCLNNTHNGRIILELIFKNTKSNWIAEKNKVVQNYINIQRILLNL